MKNTATITWLILLMLTIASALFSDLDSKYAVLFILILSALKFFGIAFQFMEIKKAHVFWKTIIIGFIFLVGIGLLLVI